MGFKCGIIGLPNVGKSTLFNALMGTATAEAANYPFCTIEPNSGIAVKEFKNFYNFDINKIYVIHDEIDLDQGRIKIKIGGGHNGHNGLKSIDQLVGKDYNRVRVGVSRPSKIFENKTNEKISSWVLSDFSPDDKIKWVDNTLDKISKHISLLINNKDCF